MCCGWCKLFPFIPSSRSGSGESLGRCLLVFHNSYRWTLIISDFGPSLLSPTSGWSSEWLPVVQRIINPTYNLVSVCVVLANIFPLAKHDAVGRNKAFCLNLSSSFAFPPNDFPRYGEATWICKTSLRVCNRDIKYWITKRVHRFQFQE